MGRLEAGASIADFHCRCVSNSVTDKAQRLSVQHRLAAHMAALLINPDVAERHRTCFAELVPEPLHNRLDNPRVRCRLLRERLKRELQAGGEERGVA